MSGEGFGNGNDWLRGEPSEEEFGTFGTSTVFGEDVPSELDQASSRRRDSAFDRAPVDPFAAAGGSGAAGSDAAASESGSGAGSRSGSRAGKGRGKGRGKKAAGASVVGAKSSEKPDSPEKKRRGGVVGYFTNPPEEGKGAKGPRKGRNGLSYTKHNRPLMWGVGMMGASLLLSGVALSVASGKASTGEIKPAVNAAVKESGQGFPKGAAVQWAGQVLRVWGTWDSTNQGAHQTYLAPFLSNGMDDQGGWNGKGTQQVVFASMNPDPVVSDANHATVYGTYQIQDGSWHCVAIPTYAAHPSGTSGPSQWAFALAANPAPSPCVPRTGVPTANNFGFGRDVNDNDQTDQDLQTNFFPGFMAAWGASDTNGMAQYAVPGVQMSGLGGSVATSPQPTISDVHLYYTGDTIQQNTTYKSVVTVQWTLAGSDSTVTSSYVVPLKKTGDRWYATAEPQPVSQGDAGTGSAPADVKQPGQDATPGGYASQSTSAAPTPATVKPGAGSASPSASSSSSSSSSASSSSSGSPSSTSAPSKK